MGKDATDGIAAGSGQARSDQPKSDQAKSDTVKTAQPFSEDAGEHYSQMGGGPPKPRPDQVDDPAMQDESDKTTQRQE